MITKQRIENAVWIPMIFGFVTVFCGTLLSIAGAFEVGIVIFGLGTCLIMVGLARSVPGSYLLFVREDWEDWEESCR